MRGRVLGVVLICALGAPPSSAARATSAIAAAAASAAATRAFAEDLVRHALSNRASAIVRASLVAAGIHPGAQVSTPARTFADGVASILNAATGAERLRSRALAGFEEITWPFRAVAPVVRDSGGDTSEMAARWDIDPAAGAAWDRIDRNAIAGATLSIVEAIERAAPVLRAGGPTTRAASHCGASGEMIFETDDCALMIGGDAANLYPTGVDPVVLIDAGGDDLYTGATAVAERNVRVVVDLGGDDEYRREAAGGTLTGQGAGLLGIGVLADLSGDDVYSLAAHASTPEPGPAPSDISIVGQGAGALGAGVLIDGGGNDHFTAETTSTGGAVHIATQGAGETGIGALIALGSPLDTGDTRSVRAVSTLHLVEVGSGFRRWQVGPSAITAQGGGTAGVGILADVIGGDKDEAYGEGSIATVAAQGGGITGVGVFVDAGGAASMSVTAIGDVTLSLTASATNSCPSRRAEVNTGETDAVAHGGALIGAGVLVDGGLGTTHRLIEARSRAAANVDIDTQADCSGFGGITAEAVARSGGSSARGQGSGDTGAGIFVDLSGDDRNDIRSSSVSVAHAVATTPGPAHENTEATPGPSLTFGHGMANIGAGVFADLSGADAYEASALTSAVRETSAGATEVRDGGTLRVLGWAFLGLGWFVDAGGADVYGADPARSRAANNSCWSNSEDTVGGRGRDLEPAVPLPATCP